MGATVTSIAPEKARMDAVVKLAMHKASDSSRIKHDADFLGDDFVDALRDSLNVTLSNGPTPKDVTAARALLNDARDRVTQAASTAASAAPDSEARKAAVAALKARSQEYTAYMINDGAVNVIAAAKLAKLPIDPDDGEIDFDDGK